MATTPAVSIIIPLYNAQRYIGECLESILLQTFEDFEVVVIDDCSTDASVEIVKSYAARFGGRLKFSRLEKNSGSGGAPRNRGIEFSRGEYVCFVDSDDMLVPTALEELYTLAENFGAEVVYCDRFFETDERGRNFQIRVMQNALLAERPTFITENLSERLQLIFDGNFGGETVLKFVRRDLIIEHEIFFPPIKPSEDEIWSYGLLFHAERFLHVPNAVYIRRLTEDSVMRAKKTPQYEMNFWLNPLINGLKYLDKLLERVEFFRQNPRYRCALLENFIHTRFFCIYEASLQMSKFEAYESIKNKFGGKLGEQDILVSFLLADLIEQQKIFVKNRELIDKLEKQLDT